MRWKLAIAVLIPLALCGCGAAKAVRDTAGKFDEYGCLSREFKGQPSCRQQEP
ncbi:MULTISPECIES: hypothetical protein [unclassified Mesorhizobium]|uniref:hypothetical protein n=1 Tax=unclassified Mesorhizobium TaxID=325217 RepID=UPI0030148BA1